MTARRRKVREEERLDRGFHRLADPARRRIIALLRESGEPPVGAVGEALAMTRNGVSEHVKVLESAGLVDLVFSSSHHAGLGAGDQQPQLDVGHAGCPEPGG